MGFNLKNRSFLKLIDFSPQEINFFLRHAADLKRAKYAGLEQPRLKGKNIALIFEKSSTRTRCAFENAAYAFCIFTFLWLVLMVHMCQVANDHEPGQVYASPNYCTEHDLL